MATVKQPSMCTSLRKVCTLVKCLQIGQPSANTLQRCPAIIVHSLQAVLQALPIFLCRKFKLHAILFVRPLYSVVHIIRFAQRRVSKPLAVDISIDSLRFDQGNPGQHGASKRVAALHPHRSAWNQCAV